MSMIDNHVPEFDKAVNHFIDDLASLNTGRANPAILDCVLVDAYGAKTPLNQMASINVPEARCILIQPWDRSVIKDIEKAICESGLGFNPVNEGDKIRITLPLMTEESRKALVKIMHQKVEEARISIRSVREEIKDEIGRAEKNKAIGEDEKYNLVEDLDKIVGEYNDKIKRIGEDKEKEIMTI